MPKRSASAVWIGIAMCMLLAHSATAGPLDLLDARPRWIEVRFEISPAEEPGSLDRRWSEPRTARFEPADPGTVRIRIPAREVEAHLRSTGTDAVEGSFSEFVWTLDAQTGHVLDAGLTGQVRERVQLGPFATKAQVAIRVRMDTERRAGFKQGQGILGVRTNRFCAPDHGDHGKGDCISVEPVRFDPSRGYVNAVGVVRAGNALAQVDAFSPLGEAEFRERAGGLAETVVSGSSAAEALCSPGFDRSCPTDHGGES